MNTAMPLTTKAMCTLGSATSLIEKMNSKRFFGFGMLSTTLTSLLVAQQVIAAPAINWNTVANNASMAPDSTGGEKFFSYNQPSVNDSGLVAFRARARVPVGSEGGGGGGGEPIRGVFTRDMSIANAPIITIASNKPPTDIVPPPNNITNPGLATFNEFPAFPRMDARTNMVAFRGQSTPALEYQTGVNPDGTAVTTRGGTSGVYTNPGGTLLTGASLLGNVNNATFPSNPNLSYFQVPGTTPGTRFDQFPGSPTATGGDTVAFKGNWTDSNGVGQTGVYFRDVLAAGGTSPIYKIASSGDAIPGLNGAPLQNAAGDAIKFGSTAPPSASDGKVVFTGLDNEDAPTAGGIFVSSLTDSLHTLKSLVSIGVSTIGGALSPVFKTVGEALSFDGSKVGFWGSWGETTKTVTVQCSSDGNAAIKAACLSQDTNTSNGQVAGDGIYIFEVPENQGIFVVDAVTGQISMKAATGTSSAFADFLFWTFSGAPDDAGGDGTDDREPPRWRSSAFVAVDDLNTVFKGLNKNGQTGLYGNFGADVFTILETGMDAAVVDAEATGMAITSLGIERDGFRNGWLAINAGMANADESWSGVYVAQVPEPSNMALMLLALGLLGVSKKYARRVLKTR